MNNTIFSMHENDFSRESFVITSLMEKDFRREIERKKDGYLVNIDSETVRYIFSSHNDDKIKKGISVLLKRLGYSLLDVTEDYYIFQKLFNLESLNIKERNFYGE